MLTSKVIFFTIISDDFYEGCRTDDFIKSFKKFHPDIELKIFRQKEIEEVFATDERLNFYNSKATFAKLLYKDYELVVWIDADYLIFDRLDAVLTNDYTYAACANYNLFLNTSLENVSELKYIQGGIIASKNKFFWNKYEELCLMYAMEYKYYDNDILNTINAPGFKYLDGHYDFRSPEFESYYGCASLGQEQLIVVNKNRLELNGKPVKAYHFAKGDRNKPHPRTLFSEPVINWINETLDLNY